MPPVVLIVRAGPLAGQRIEVDQDVVVGREGADVTIQDPQLSRRHASIKLVDGGLEIEDLESLNGTYVNAGRIEVATRLAAGDVVQIGETTFEVELELTRSDATDLRPTPERGASETRAAQPASAPAPAREPQPPPAAAPAPARAEAPPAAFGALASGHGRKRSRPASRLLTPTLLAFGAIVATAAALIVYFAGR